MADLQKSLSEIVSDLPDRLILSKQADKAQTYRKAVIEQKNNYYQIAKYTEKQVFHENCDQKALLRYLGSIMGTQFLQLNAWSKTREHQLLMSRKGTVTYRKKLRKDAKETETHQAPASHNRKKRYLLQEGTIIPPLIDMGIFTKEGKVVHAMYDKFRQINRYLEFIEDILDKLPTDRCIRIIDFGCGKSYLTFAMYYYLHQLQGRDIQVTGLDLKEDVIRHCGELARKLHYDGLEFRQGDISSFQGADQVDMVVSLHACDKATDYALEKAVKWGASVIMAVPCCQHELNGQIRCDMLRPVLKYGVIRERMAALITDALRANLLEQNGYDTQILEFIDMEHTPKNLMIRAVKTSGMRPGQAADSFEKVTEFLHVNPTLKELL